MLTDTDRATNPFWGIFEDACGQHGTRVEREIFPAATDSRFLRARNVPAIGFSPMANTPMLLHEHNESLSVSTFVKGVSVYVSVIDSLASAERQHCEPAAGKRSGDAIDADAASKKAKA